MKATLFHWLKLISTAILFLITIILVISYEQTHNTTTIIFALIFFILTLAIYIILSIKVNNELIRRNERIRIAERKKQKE